MGQMTLRESTQQLVSVVQSEQYQQKFKAMLPPDVPLERFTAVIVRAVQEDPNLAAPDTDRTSLLLACQRAAQDGLIPDKREGALVMYGKKVQWQPMILGLRKKLAGVGFDLRAEVVHENDTFDYELGDNPTLTHKPAPLGQPRGKMIGAYAIATNLTSGEKYREVMSIEQLNAVAAVSRSGGSGPWKGPFRTEMDRKTVARRLIKSLPIDDRRLREMLERDDKENFDFSAPRRPETSDIAQRVQAAARGESPPNDEPQPGEIAGDFREVPPDDDAEPEVHF